MSAEAALDADTALDVSALPRHVAVLLRGIGAARLSRIVDVGANPFNDPPYLALLKAGGCEVTGFEPQEDALERLNASKGPHETYLPHAVGDGGEGTLRVFKLAGFTSLYPPDQAAMAFLGKPRWGRVEREVPLTTVTLDDCPGLGPFDLLKIDIQGGECDVFRGARRLLAEALVVISEVRFYPLYEGEPMLGGVDCELRDQGFQLHKFMFTESRALGSPQMERLRFRQLQDQLVDGDAVYLRDMRDMTQISDEQLKHLAILAAAVFASHSLVLFCLDHLIKRGAIPAALPEAYADALPKRLHKPDPAGG